MKTEELRAAIEKAEKLISSYRGLKHWQERVKALEMVISAARSTLEFKPTTVVAINQPAEENQVIATVEFKAVEGQVDDGPAIFVPLETGSRGPVGRLGATVNPDWQLVNKLAVGLDMAERRILRLEAAIEFAGVKLSGFELPE